MSRHPDVCLPSTLAESGSMGKGNSTPGHLRRHHRFRTLSECSGTHHQVSSSRSCRGSQICQQLTSLLLTRKGGSNTQRECRRNPPFRRAGGNACTRHLNGQRHGPALPLRHRDPPSLLCDSYPRPWSVDEQYIDNDTDRDQKKKNLCNGFCPTTQEGVLLLPPSRLKSQRPKNKSHD